MRVARVRAPLVVGAACGVLAVALAVDAFVSAGGRGAAASPEVLPAVSLEPPAMQGPSSLTVQEGNTSVASSVRLADNDSVLLVGESVPDVVEIGGFIDPDDMTTWPEGDERIIGEYRDPDTFMAGDRAPVEIGEWIDPESEYFDSPTLPIEVGGFEDPDQPSPSDDAPIVIGEYVDPDSIKPN